MISSRFVYSLGLAVLLAATLLYRSKYNFENPNFYTRLKRKKRQILQARNLHFTNSTIQGSLLRNDSPLVFSIELRRNSILHLQINDPLNPRYQIRDVIINEDSQLPHSNIDLREEQGKFRISCAGMIILLAKKTFEIEIYKEGNLILAVKDFLLEEALSATFFFSKAVKAYGLPQRSERFALEATTKAPYRMYNSDRPGFSWQPQKALYGSVPILYGHSREQTTGVLWLNASETFVDLDFTPDGLLSTFFSEGGCLDFYVLGGPSLKDCVKQYAGLSGAVPLPPLFSLGYHQSRFSYMSQEEVAEVSDKFDEHNLPLDCIWLDIDCTDEKRYFTWNPKTYSDPHHMLNYLESKGRKAVVIVDPHIKVDPNYFVYSQCEKADFFVKDAALKPYQARCWPGTSSWIDFLNPEARKHYSNLHKNLLIFPNLFIWNDMNEPAVFDMKDNTSPKDLIHYGNVSHRDVHSLYGFYQTMATFDGLLKRHNARPFILTRSHFVGSQRFAAIWTGDNLADWNNLKLSISMCLTASLAGFSLCGADVGGFYKIPSEELIRRWFQLGAWLPFFRGHSNNDVPRREPYLYSEEVCHGIRESLVQRYSHLLYWYTLFWEHQSCLEPVLRALVYEFPEDVKVLDIDRQFMVGGQVLVCPVLEDQCRQIKVYLPGERNTLWYDLESKKRYSGNGFRSITAGLETIPVFYKGGSIIPIVDVPIKSSASLLDSPITLYIFCDVNGTASGTIYLDDGATFNYRKGAYSYVKVKLDGSAIYGEQINRSQKFEETVTLGSVKIFALESVTEANVEGRKLSLSNQNPLCVELNEVNVDLRHNFEIRLKK